MENTTKLFVKIKETIDVTVDCKNTEKIKQHTRWIAKATECPVITSIFGTFENPHCYIRLDLN